MKKAWVLLAVIVAFAGTLFLAVRQRSRDREGEDRGKTDVARQRVEAFWNTYSRASALRAQGDFEGAETAYREALRLDPTHEDSIYYLGTTLEAMGDYRGAQAVFAKILERNPSSGRAWGALGQCLSVIAPGAPADFEGARQAFRRIIQINREQAVPFQRLGMLDLNQGRFDSALEQFRVAAGFGSPEGSFLAGYTLFLEKKYSAAAPYFLKVLERFAAEKRITGRGVLSEGDILPGPGKPMTPLESASLRSMLFLHWIASRTGGYPSGVPKEFRVQAISGSRLPPGPAEEPPGPGRSGGRAAWADVDKNGRASLVVVGPGRPVALYRSLGGKLVNVTRAAGLERVREAWDAAWGDYDGDGYPDLYLVRPGFTGAGQSSLYHNNRDGTFSEVTGAVGLRGERATSKALFLDSDGDGRLDLLELGRPDESHGSLRLFRNVGNRFVEETREAGLLAGATAVDCAVADYDHDDRPDLFVLNWKREARLYHNQGNGTFIDRTAQAGLEGIRGERFSALFFDYDRDGWMDLLVTAHAPFEEVVRGLLQRDFKVTRNTPRLFRNKGQGSFEEVSERVGLNRPYGTMQAVAVDLDSDGWPDLLLVNGSLDAGRLEPSVALRNVQGREFREWFYVPGRDTAGNFIGVSAGNTRRQGLSGLDLAENPILRAR